MRIHLVLSALAVAFGLATPNPLALAAQVPLGQPQTIEDMEWNIRNIRPTGMPIIPVFDGWLPKDDGTADLCFGYISLNLQEARDIPIGPDNFVVPERYNGRQPTHFREVPPGYRRYFCVFALNVETGAEPVFWTLRHRGRQYSTPGHTNSEEYVMDNLYQPSRDAIAPVVQFVEPADPVRYRGRGELLSSVGPIQAMAGTPVTLRFTAEMPEGEEYAELEPRRFRILWGKYAGPGEVTFTEFDTNLEEGQAEASTEVTFSEPGRHRLIMQAMNGNFGGQCCWTTAYVDVDVR